MRFGIAYIGRRADGAWLLERRPPKGLLGGTLGWPGTDWATSDPIDAPPILADWRALDAEVRHTFTHFHLRLSLRVAALPMDAPGNFVAPAAFNPRDLPTLMRKAHALAAPVLGV